MEKFSGGPLSLHVHITFSVFGFLWYCADFFCFMGVLSLSQNIFFKMVYV